MNFQGAGVGDLNWQINPGNLAPNSPWEDANEGVMRAGGSEELESFVDSKTFWNGLFAFCDSSCKFARIYAGLRLVNISEAQPSKGLLSQSLTDPDPTVSNSIKQYISI